MQRENGSSRISGKNRNRKRVIGRLRERENGSPRISGKKKIGKDRLADQEVDQSVDPI